MATYRTGQGFIEIPHAAVYVLLTANIVAFGLCLNQATGQTIPIDVLYRDGAMYTSALQRHEYWRLVAYGFLHFNLVHLLGNMLCLVLWGGHLERRVGAAYFLVIYACALIFGALVGHFIHTTPYLTAGASGATSGILGALLCLWLLGKLDFPFGFFVINIGLNVVIAFNARVDWGVHLGGFAAGLIACAALDLVEKANARLLRCKFPESRPICSRWSLHSPSCSWVRPTHRKAALRSPCMPPSTFSSSRRSISCFRARRGLPSLPSCSRSQTRPSSRLPLTHSRRNSHRPAARLARPRLSRFRPH
jgi:membrane associated rhomboid family serine protease